MSKKWLPSCSKEREEKEETVYYVDNIDMFTPEQKAKLLGYRDKWIAFGLSTEPTDREAAEHSVDLVYHSIGLPRPKHKEWGRSPLESCFSIHRWLDTRSIMFGAPVLGQIYTWADSVWWEHVWSHMWKQIKDQLEDQLLDQVAIEYEVLLKIPMVDRVDDQMKTRAKATLWNHAMTTVRNDLWKQIRAQIKLQIENQGWEQVRSQVWKLVWYPIWTQVWEQVKEYVLAPSTCSGPTSWAPVWPEMFQCHYGMHNADRVGIYDFFYTEMAATDLGELQNLCRIAKSCGWWWPFEQGVFLTDRPTFIARDQNFNLHCEDKAAVSYSDGFSIYCWHGITVPEWIIKQPELITIDKINQEQKPEIRRVLLERFGEERYQEETAKR